MKLITHDYWEDRQYGGYPEHFQLLVDPEAAEYLIKALQLKCSQELDLLAARNRGKSIINVDDVDDIKRIIDIRETMDKCIYAMWKVREVKEKSSSEEEPKK